MPRNRSPRRDHDREYSERYRGRATKDRDAGSDSGGGSMSPERKSSRRQDERSHKARKSSRRDGETDRDRSKTEGKDKDRDRDDTRERKEKRSKMEKDRSSRKDRRRSRSRSQSAEAAPPPKEKALPPPPKETPLPPPPPAPAVPKVAPAVVEQPAPAAEANPPEKRRRRMWDQPSPSETQASAFAMPSAANPLGSILDPVQAALSKLQGGLLSGLPMVNLPPPPALPGPGSAGFPAGLSNMAMGLDDPPTPAPTIVAVASQFTNPLTKNARRLYVGNVPERTPDAKLLAHLNSCFIKRGIEANPGKMPVVDCKVNSDKCCAFIEMATPEEAQAALGMDGLKFDEVVLKIRRPMDYNPKENVPEYRKRPVVLPEIVSSRVYDGPHKLYLGNIPFTFTSEQVCELVTSFGCLKAFKFLPRESRDKAKAAAPSSAFLQFVDSDSTAMCAAGLSGLWLANHALVCVRADPSLSSATKHVSYSTPPHAKPLLAAPQRVLRIDNAISFDTLLKGDAAVLDAEEDVRLGCEEMAHVCSAHTPRLPPWYQVALAETDPQIKSTATATTVAADQEESGPTSETETEKPASQAGSGGERDGDKPAVNGAGAGKAQGPRLEDPMLLRIHAACATNAARQRQAYGLGSVFVEFVSEKSAQTVAMAMHLREYDGKTVHVTFVPHSEYVSKFGKGLPPTTIQEKHAISIAAHERLAKLVKDE